MTDDLALALAIDRGDVAAVRVLVDRESPRLIRLCARILGDADDAQDVVQDAFVIACRSMASYRGDGSLGAWVSRIAARLAFRRRRQDQRTLNLAGLDDLAGVDDPQMATFVAAQGDSLRSAIACLSDLHREVITLRYFGEMTLDEIATATGRPMSTVKSDLRRALKRLRSELERESAA